MSSKWLGIFSLCTLFLFTFTLPALAQETEKFQIGSFIIWTVADSTGERDMSVFTADAELLKRYVPAGKAPSGVMTFVLRTADQNILIDTGHGRPQSRLMPGLAAIGLKPEDINLILITHMHGDHIGGLLSEGARAFPKAKVLIGRKEHDFWLNKNSPAEFPGREANFDLAQKVVDIYGDDVQTFQFEEEIVLGVKALEAGGHTPGHTAFLMESGGRRLLCIGDLLHAAALQFPRPDLNASYDMAPDQARASRERILKMAADEGLPIAGMHVAFPALGRVIKTGENSYEFQPGLK